MACSKYTLTNTGSTIVNFNYRRCDDSLWEYQVELNPNQTKNIWVINGTYTISPVYTSSVSLINQGAFPPISETATPTPTPSITPSNTPTGTAAVTPTPTTTLTSTPTPTTTLTATPTETPTNTPTTTTTLTSTPTTTTTLTSTPTPTTTLTATPTQTPTPTPALQSFSVFSGTTKQIACNSSTSITLYAFYSLFDANSQFYNDPTGVVTIDLTGYYVNSGQVVQLNSNGDAISSFDLCSVVPTTTPTPTQTQTPTSTFAWYTYSLGTGGTANAACLAFSASPQTIYGSVAGGVGPNVGEYLYETAARPLTDVVPDGYYSNGTAWYQVTGGAGQITSSDPNGC
jgi:hypothetical protein